MTFQRLSNPREQFGQAKARFFLTLRRLPGVWDGVTAFTLLAAELDSTTKGAVVGSENVEPMLDSVFHSNEEAASFSPMLETASSTDGPGNFSEDAIESRTSFGSGARFLSIPPSPQSPRSLCSSQDWLLQPTPLATHTPFWLGCGPGILLCDGGIRERP